MKQLWIRLRAGVAPVLFDEETGLERIRRRTAEHPFGAIEERMAHRTS
jgi:hypothetical protein